MADYVGRKAVVKYGTIVLPADSYQYSATAKSLESLTTESYPKFPGSLDGQFFPRIDPMQPDMGHYPLGTPLDDARRCAMHGVTPTQIFGGIRRGNISLEGFYLGPLLGPRLGNLVTVQLYHNVGGFIVGRGVGDGRDAIQLGVGASGYVTATIMVTEATYRQALRNYLRWTIKGEMHGEFDVLPV
jgi:hypothetical protein